ncbi:hypothetical protein BGZ63DRAFT_418067 [Mariannaea sp. PMI_226]|nr:hypothetical protein BGZ63DRAFT_418067 [Mariannaea sp. PMI_226]
MSHFTVNDGVAIFQLVYYTIALGLGIWVSARHGFLKSSGWIFLAIFSSIRIVSSSSQIATLTTKSETAVTISLITGILGLSPLLLATLGILSRVWYSFLESPWNTIFSFGVIKAVQTPAAIALILCIVGATSANNPAEIGDQGPVKAGIVLYLVVFVFILLLTAVAAVGIRMTKRGEAKLLRAVAMSLPFLLVRIIYSLLSIFSDNANFSTASGSWKSAVIEIFMVRIEEMSVMAIYLWVGVRQKATPSNDDGTERTMAERLRYRTERGDFGYGKLGLISLAANAIFEMLPPKEGANQEPDLTQGGVRTGKSTLAEPASR